MGCSSLVPSSLVALRGLSPLEADPEGFVVGLDLPDEVRVVPGSARLTLRADRTDIAEERAGSFVLQESVSEGASFYRVAPEDLEALRTLQSEINAWETVAPDATSGSLSVSLTTCREVADVPDDATVSVDLQLDVGGPFVPLLRDAPLTAILDAAALDQLAPCS